MIIIEMENSFQVTHLTKVKKLCLLFLKGLWGEKL